MSRPMVVSEYATTPEFRAVEKHVAVAFKDDGGLCAVTGPAGDVGSISYAKLFVGASDMQQALRDAARDLGDIMRHAEPESVREQAATAHARIVEALKAVEP